MGELLLFSAFDFIVFFKDFLVSFLSIYFFYSHVQNPFLFLCY